jgi:hypothetical protein
MKTPLEQLHMADRPLTGWRLRLVKDVLKIVKTDRADHECTTPFSPSSRVEDLCEECIKINALSLLLDESRKEVRLETDPGLYGHSMNTLGQFCEVMVWEQWDGDADSGLPAESWRD